MFLIAQSSELIQFIPTRAPISQSTTILSIFSAILSIFVLAVLLVLCVKGVKNRESYEYKQLVS